MRHAALPKDRAVRAAGGVSALIVVVLAGWVAGLLRVNDQWVALACPRPRGATVLTRVAVGVPVLGVAVLLLAERSARRYGGVLLVAGGLWLLPSAAAGLLGLGDLGTAGAVLSLLLAAAKMACRPLTVLLLPPELEVRALRVTVTVGPGVSTFLVLVTVGAGFASGVAVTVAVAVAVA
ncbi:hypothetical protein ACFXEZ_38585, partial [Streptomyces hygroscopicus]